MSIHLKRIVFFFCILCFGLGSFPGNRAMAQIDWWTVHIPTVTKDANAVRRAISGFVYENGNGLGGVEIYKEATLTIPKKLLAVTNSDGYYKVMLDPGVDYTLTPEKTHYQFTPSSRTIPANDNNYDNQNFTAQTAVTISGNVKWTNGMFYTIPSNPLPMVAMEGYAEDGSLDYRAATDVDGNYSLTVPSDWRGLIKPSKESFEFSPETSNYTSVKANDSYNFSAPRPTVSGGHVYKITVSVKLTNNNVPPLSNHIYIQFDGINHANGSRLSQTGGVGLDSLTGECDTYAPQAWIGDIKPTNDGVLSVSYNFDPVSIRMSNPITSDMTFSFKATPK